jgi:hypothetical protein
MVVAYAADVPQAWPYSHFAVYRNVSYDQDVS